MSTDITTRAGVFTQADGPGQSIRQSRTGELIVNVDNYEGSSRAKVYSLHTAVTGATVAAGHVSPPAAAAATTLTLSNPLGSGVNFKILRGMIANVTGTTGTGAWSWCAAQATGSLLITATANAVAKNQKVDGAASVGLGYTATALTAGPLNILTRIFPTATFATAMDASTQNKCAIDEVNGQLVIPPGYILTLAPPSAGSAWVVVAAIVYEEVPIPS